MYYVISYHIWPYQNGTQLYMIYNNGNDLPRVCLFQPKLSLMYCLVSMHMSTSLIYSTENHVLIMLYLSCDLMCPAHYMSWILHAQWGHLLLCLTKYIFVAQFSDLLWDIQCHCVLFIWRLSYIKHVTQAGISNSISHYSVGCNYLSLPEMSASGTKVIIYHSECHSREGAVI